MRPETPVDSPRRYGVIANVDRYLEPPFTGPIVRLRSIPDGFAVLIEPALSSGEQSRQEFPPFARDTAWGYARAVAADNRLGFVDETTGNWGRTLTP